MAKLQKLNQKHKRFAMLIAQGYSKSDAYRQIFDPEMEKEDHTIWSRASRLSNDELIQEEIDRQIQIVREDHEITVDWLISEAKSVLAKAKRDGKYTDALKALDYLTKMTNLYPKEEVNSALEQLDKLKKFLNGED